MLRENQSEEQAEEFDDALMRAEDDAPPETMTRAQVLAMDGEVG